MPLSHNSEIKKAVMAELADNPHTPGIVEMLTRKYDVSESTIRKWRRDDKNTEKTKEVIKAAIDRYPAIPAIGSYNCNSMVISDLHCPFNHVDSFDFCKEIKQKYKPKNIICVGDETDQHAFGRFPKDPDGYGASKELEKAIEQLIPFYKEFPNVMVCESNHGTRAYKRAFEAALPSAFLRDIEQVMNAPEGWVWAEHWVVDDVLYMHGDPYCGRAAVIKHMHETFMSVAIGHTHSYGRAEHFITRFRKYFALDVGCLINHEAYAFKYAKKINRRPTLGCGVVYDKEHAEFIAMQTDHHGRWTGKL